MQKKGVLILISGTSGVGKTTILNELFKDKSLNLKYSVSMTTRNMRPDEKEGKNYFFVDHDTFDMAIKNHELMEWAKFADNKYGTPKKYVLENLEAGFNVILEIEVKGAMQIMEIFPEVLTIFIMPPDFKTTEIRLRNRNTEGVDAINKRLEIAEYELKYSSYYKYIVVNDMLVKSVQEIKNIIREYIEKQS